VIIDCSNYNDTCLSFALTSPPSKLKESRVCIWSSLCPHLKAPAADSQGSVVRSPAKEKRKHGKDQKTRQKHQSTPILHEVVKSHSSSSSKQPEIRYVEYKRTNGSVGPRKGIEYVNRLRERYMWPKKNNHSLCADHGNSQQMNEVNLEMKQVPQSRQDSVREEVGSGRGLSDQRTVVVACCLEPR
jgi:hypothetical protein